MKRFSEARLRVLSISHFSFMPHAAQAPCFDDFTHFFRLCVAARGESIDALSLDKFPPASRFSDGQREISCFIAARQPHILKSAEAVSLSLMSGPQHRYLKARYRLFRLIF